MVSGVMNVALGDGGDRGYRLYRIRDWGAFLYLPSLPNTSFSNVVVCAAGFFRICFSSSPSM